MRKLGVILHISSHGYIILRAALFPKINSSVLTKRMERIGKVHDIFGPVLSPYISVKPSKKMASADLKKLIGEKVYV
ncbi:MAG: H/ACA ribonucleoprotein complex subunit GAR1 [Halobacteriota archaeon]